MRLSLDVNIGYEKNCVKYLCVSVYIYCQTENKSLKILMIMEMTTTKKAVLAALVRNYSNQYLVATRFVTKG